MKKKIFFENLDGLRFLCFLSVFLFHSFYTDSPEIKSSDAYLILKNRIFGNGNLGVNFFFVLSGFLITYLLIEEKKKIGRIDVPKFWFRRILRIWPLYFFCVFFGFFIFPQLKAYFGQTPSETANIFYYITFLNNFDIISSGLPDSSVLGVLWSIAIEEQFYFVLPLILYFFPTRWYGVIFTLLIVSSFVFRAIYDSYLNHEMHTLSCTGDLIIGAMGAWLIQEKEGAKLIIENLKRSQIVVMYLAFIVILLFRKEILLSNYSVRIFERGIIAVIMLFIILEQNYARESFFKLSRFKFISKLGTISYGLYCLHFVGILITLTISKKLGFSNESWTVIFLETILSLVITIAISSFSYKYYEGYFLKLKDKFSNFSKV